MKMDKSLKMLQEKLIKYINRNLYTYCISDQREKVCLVVLRKIVPLFHVPERDC